MSNYHWENPVRTGTDEDGPTLAERTHVPDPAAVERLKRLMASQRAARPAPSASEAQRRGGKYIVANLMRRRAELERMRLPDEKRLRELHAEHLAGARPADLAAPLEVSYQRLCAEWRNMGLEVLPAGRNRPGQGAGQ